MANAVRTAVDAPPSPPATHSRIVVLDAIRAVAIISMVIGHVANYSFLWRTSHATYYVWDGAQLFMLVSGVVVGVVHHRIVQRQGARASYVKLAKRAGLLYVIHVLLVLLGIALSYGVPGPWTADFRPAGVATWQEAVGWSLLLQANPIYINFLGSYVLILLAAIPVVALLRRGRVRLLLVLTAVVYVVGLVAPSAFTLRNGPDSLAGFNNATWFVLFVSGMIAGWYWHRWHVAQRLVSRPVMTVTSILFALMLVAVVIDITSPAMLGPVDWWFDKDVMAPGRLLASWVFFVLLFRVATWIDARSWGSRIIEPAAVLGGRALDAVVILTVASIVLPVLTQQPSSSRLAQVLALVVLGLCWAWAYARHAWRHRADGPGARRFAAR